MPSRRALGSCHQGGFSVVPSRGVPSRGVPSRRVRNLAIKVGGWFLKQVNGASTSVRDQILLMVVVAGRAVTAARVLGLSVPHGQVGSGFNKQGQICLGSVGLVSQSVGRSAGSTMPESDWAYQALAVAASSGGGRKLWRWQQALEVAANSGGGRKLWRRYFSPRSHLLRIFCLSSFGYFRRRR